MIDSNWENDHAPAKSKGRPPWLRILFVISAVLVVSLLLLGFQVRSHRITVWGHFRRVMAQVGNDANARALYRRSPGLTRRYANETRFLDYIKTYRSVLQMPPIDEPINDGQRYFVIPLPTTTTIRFRFENGTTVSATIKHPGLFRFSPEGEARLDGFDIRAVRMLPGAKQ